MKIGFICLKVKSHFHIIQSMTLCLASLWNRGNWGNSEMGYWFEGKRRCHQHNTKNCKLINRVIMRIFCSCTWCSVCDSCLWCTRCSKSYVQSLLANKEWQIGTNSALSGKIADSKSYAYSWCTIPEGNIYCIFAKLSQNVLNDRRKLKISYEHFLLPDQIQIFWIHCLAREKWRKNSSA